MKSFKISCIDEEKNVVGEQIISMSYNPTYAHKISFVGESNHIHYTIDTLNSELILDNSDGTYDLITQDKPIAKVKVSNIQLDYEDNITFSLDDSKTTYRLTANAFEKKQGSTFITINTFEKPLDIVLPSTLFNDMQTTNLKINGFPFQIFEALTDQDKQQFDIETYQSSSKLLNIIKIKDEIFIARGKKFIPVDISNQNYYKIGDKSVFGLTIGTNNGIQGKQSQGIAFNMPETELEDVAKFLNGGLDKITFKSQSDLDSNTIDYKRINKQSDLEKTLLGVTPIPQPQPEPIPQPQPEPTPQPQPEPITQPQPEPITQPQPEIKKDKPKEDKPKDSKKLEKVEGELGPLCAALALITGLLLISGFIFGTLAWVLFGLFTFGAITDFTITGYDYGKLSKEEKAKMKLDRMQKSLDKLRSKKHNRFRDWRVQQLEKGINKQKSKLGLSNSTENHTNIQENTVAEQNNIQENNAVTRENILTDESQIDSEMTDFAQNNTNNSSLTNNGKNSIRESLSSVLQNKPTSIVERNAMINNINNKVQAICPDGTNTETVSKSDKKFYQSCVDFRIAYIAEQSAKTSYEQAVANGSDDEILLADAAYQQARDNVNTQLNNLYDASAENAITAPVIDQPDAGRSI